MPDQRVLPEQPNLRYLKLEAKRRLAAGEFSALHQAQLAIAREHGVRSWTALKQLIADQGRPEGHALAQLRWIMSRFADAGAPGWTAPGDAELREHFAEEFLAQFPPDSLTEALSNAAPYLREELAVTVDLPFFARAQLAGIIVTATAEVGPAHRLTGLQYHRGGSLVTDPRTGSPPAVTSGDVPAAVARIAAAAIDELGLACLALAGGEPGRIWSMATGWANLDRDEALSSSHRFPAYDITKAITAVTVLRLVADGRLGLDDPANSHLRTVRLADDAVTVRDLLTHTSGVGELPEPFGPCAADLVTLAGPVLACTGDRGTFRPCHAGYAALGQLVTDITGLPYPGAASRLVLRPLDMRRSGFPARWPRTGAVTGYQVAADGLFDPMPRSVCVSLAAGGLWTTAADLVRFGLGWPHLLPPHLAAEALRPQAATTSGGHSGLGWFVNEATRLAGLHGFGPSGAASLLVPLSGGRATAALASRPVLAELVNAQVLSEDLPRRDEAVL